MEVENFFTSISTHRRHQKLGHPCRRSCASHAKQEQLTLSLMPSLCPSPTGMVWPAVALGAVMPVPPAVPGAVMPAPPAVPGAVMPAPVVAPGAVMPAPVVAPGAVMPAPVVAPGAVMLAPVVAPGAVRPAPPVVPGAVMPASLVAPGAAAALWPVKWCPWWPVACQQKAHGMSRKVGI